MRCDDALRAISAAADGELSDAVLVETTTLAQLEEHLAQCDECARFERNVVYVRSQLRFEPIASVPDVVAGVMAEIPARGVLPRNTNWTAALTLRPRMRIVAAAAAVIGVVMGATCVSLGEDHPPMAASMDLRDLVLSAQREISSLDSAFEITEHGRPDQADDDGRRRFDGELSYRAPEEATLSLVESGVPDDGARPGNLRQVVDGAKWSLDAVRSCGPCPGGVAERHETVEGREPFSDTATSPVELVTAVDSFALTGEPTEIGERTIADREAVGVRVPASQMVRLLAALSPADDLRAVYPSDPVDVWLDHEQMVPLAVEVSADTSPERAVWAATQGYLDTPGETVLSFTVRSLAVNAADDAGSGDGDDGGDDDRQEWAEGDTESAESAEADDGSSRDGVQYDAATEDGFATAEQLSRLPEGTATTPVSQPQPGGFQAGDPAVAPEPDFLPSGFEPYLTGTVTGPEGPSIGVRSWSDGRAWAKVRATAEWTASRLFGDLGTTVRLVDLGSAGVGYMSADGDKIAVHTDEVDLVVSGTLAADQLRAVAASLGVEGLPAPEGWPETAARTLDGVGIAVPDLLVPTQLDGFAAPAVRESAGTVSQHYAGPGDRSFVLTQSASPDLPPPSNGDSEGLTVRQTLGRYSAQRGELEWSENGSSFSLSSPTLTKTELVDIAGGLGLVDPANGNPREHAGDGQGHAREPGGAGEAVAEEAATTAAPGGHGQVAPPSAGGSRPSVLLAWTPDLLAEILEPTARAIPGVSEVSVVHEAITNLAAARDSEGRLVQQLDPGWAIPLDTVAVTPTTYATFASLADRAAVAALRDGEALLSRTSARLRGLAAGGTVELADGTRLVVSGIVDDATLGAAELAVTTATGNAIGVDRPRYMLVAHDGDRIAVEAALRASLESGDPVMFQAPDQTPYLRQGQATLPPMQLKQRFGEFAYQPAADEVGGFVQDPVWQLENLVERDLPILGPTKCHRAVIDDVERALREIESANLADLIDPTGVTGCWRPQLAETGDEMSPNAWGVALDLAYGSTGHESIQDPRVVEVFDRWGFTWGGGWLVSEPTHFEFARPVVPARN